MKHKFPTLLLFLLFTVACKKENSIVQNLQQQNKVDNSYFLYPSTLRMLNLADIESIDKVVKDVKKVSVLNMNTDSFDFQQLTDIAAELQEKEAYDLYLEIEDTEQQFYILGNESSEKSMFLASTDGRHYVVEIEGKPDYFQLALAVRDFNEMDSTSTVAFSALRQMMDQDNSWRDGRRERRRQAEERRAAEQAKLDSIKNEAPQLLN